MPQSMLLHGSCLLTGLTISSLRAFDAALLAA
jgi:hypothetical protein